ncbi:MAG: hypothetical protein ABIF77_20245 [bacterium]
MWKQFVLILGLVYLLNGGTARAQYWQEQVLEKSFEQMDFFFQPTVVNPYGIGGFGGVAPGLIDDPLLNLRLNPAYLAAESLQKQYFYLNFRSSHEIKESDVYYPMWDRGFAECYGCYYPQYYLESRKQLEPVLSLAGLFRPFDEQTGLTIGFDYEAILQDEAYYEIPQDIYRSSVGTDFTGAEVAAPADIPIVDRYSGDDQIHHEGHFFNLMAALPLSNGLDLGARVGRALFDRDGAYGSRNLWEYSSSRPSSSEWYNMTGRDQEYDHWDRAAGLNIDLSPTVCIGLSGGYLTGEVSQTLFRDEDSSYEYGTIGEDDYWSRYHRTAATDQEWKHDGKNVYGGLNLTARLNDDQTLNISYRYADEEVDLTLRSTVSDTSSGAYHHEYDYATYDSESSSSLVDNRTGNGTRAGETHRASAALQWRIGERTRLHLGANLTYQHRRTRTVESVYANRFSDYQWTHDTEVYESYYSVNERKDLYWDFETSETAFHLPLMLYHQVSPAVELQFGLKRTMRRWKINDVTLAIFDYRTEINNGDTEHETDFGERYTQPEEKQSDVTTTMLTGLSVNPSEHLQIRFLVVPNFEKTWDGTELSDLQWWIDFRLF